MVDGRRFEKCISAVFTPPTVKISKFLKHKIADSRNFEQELSSS